MKLVVALVVGWIAHPSPTVMSTPPFAPKPPSPPIGKWSDASVERRVHLDAHGWSDSVVATCDRCPETLAMIHAEVQSAVRPSPVHLVAVDHVTGERREDSTCFEDTMPDWPRDTCTLRANTFRWPGDGSREIDVHLETTVPVDVRVFAIVMSPGD